MTDKKIGKKDIAKLLEEWRDQFTFFTPSRESGVAAFAEWDGKDLGFLDWYRNTVVPPKASLLPPVEAMFRFEKGKEGYSIEPLPKEENKRLLFGVRPCDARAISIVDMTFKDAYEDPYYLSKRQNTVLVGLGCTNPCESCFCTSMGTSPAESADVDLMFIDIGDDFLIEEVTERGKELSKDLKEATKEDGDKAEQSKKAAYDKVTRKLDTEGIKDKLSASFDDQDFWEKVAAKCISCGICTLLCPTCFCFDINDEMVRQEGTRFRSWDSCGFPTYTKMPMENPRQEKWRRVRQKVCHKYGFYPMTFNVIACTGCGRCVRLCPVNWDITQVIESVPNKTEAVK